MTDISDSAHHGGMEREPTTIESCHSTWIFDAERMRFRRILKDTEVGGQPVTTGWRPYYRLEADPGTETFTVYLNLVGSRVLRSWRHDADCTQCGQHATREVPLEKVRAALNN